ncbi:MAG: nucleotidyl transferase AbiEii/AbiGii toxin family protein [Acidobacteriota bacterium]
MSRLDSLQQEVLRAFFEYESRFFLTGGAALAGFHLQHRTTKDLDLFTVEDRLEEGAAALAAVARQLGGSLESLVVYVDFRRYLLRRGSSSIVVELVRDRAPQLVESKPAIGSIRVDPPEEIIANKLCTLLSRAEIRDLVDVRALEAAGFPVEDHIGHAARKDGGMTPGQLGWVLSQIVIGDDAELPEGVSANELRAYLHDLQNRLADMAFPES